MTKIIALIESKALIAVSRRQQFATFGSLSGPDMLVYTDGHQA